MLIVPLTGNIARDGRSNGCMLLVFVGLGEGEPPAKVALEELGATTGSGKANGSTVLHDIHNFSICQCGFRNVPLQLGVGVREESPVLVNIGCYKESF
mgnify:CR=1 FL=1